MSVLRYKAWRENAFSRDFIREQNVMLTGRSERMIRGCSESCKLRLQWPQTKQWLGRRRSRPSPGRVKKQVSVELIY